MRTKPIAAALSSVVLLAAVNLAASDKSSVEADPTVKFAAFKTFAMRSHTIGVTRPELDNPLFEKQLAKSIVAALTSRSLTETTGPADLVVDFTITGQDFGRSVRPFRFGGRVPVRFTEGTLVIDLSKPSDASPIWRGVYEDDESTGSKLVQKLPEDARKLISKYPALKK